MLRDWMLELSGNKYYEVEKIKDRTENDDMMALGNILLEVATLIECNALAKHNINL